MAVSTKLLLAARTPMVRPSITEIATDTNIIATVTMALSAAWTCTEKKTAVKGLGGGLVRLHLPDAIPQRHHAIPLIRAKMREELAELQSEMKKTIVAGLVLSMTLVHSCLLESGKAKRAKGRSYLAGDDAR